MLTGYRTVRGPLESQALRDTVVISDAMTPFVLALRLEAPESVDAAYAQVNTAGMMSLHRAEVHQASGMLAVQLDVSLATALTRLRAEAFATNRDVLDVARGILAGRLRPASHQGPAEGPNNNHDCQDPGDSP